MDAQKALGFLKSGEYSDLILTVEYDIIDPTDGEEYPASFDFKLHKIVMQGHCEQIDDHIRYESGSSKWRVSFLDHLMGTASAIYYMYTGEYDVTETIKTIPGLADALNRDDTTRIPPDTDVHGQRRWLAESHMQVHLLGLCSNRNALDFPKGLRDAAKQQLLAVLEESGCFERFRSNAEYEVLHAVIKMYFEQENDEVDCECDEEYFRSGRSYYTHANDKGDEVFRAIMDRCVSALLNGGLNEKIIGTLFLFRPKVMMEVFKDPNNQYLLRRQRWRHDPDRTH